MFLIKGMKVECFIKLKLISLILSAILTGWLLSGSMGLLTFGLDNERMVDSVPPILNNYLPSHSGLRFEYGPHWLRIKNITLVLSHSLMDHIFLEIL